MTELVQRDLNWARKITERLRLQATNYAEAREKVIATLIEARDGGASALLGYASWTAYMADVFGDAPLRLERDARQELVAELTAEGMSTRAIAPIVGVSQMQVVRDAQASPETNVSPAPDFMTPPSEAAREHLTAWRASREPDVPDYVDTQTGEVIDPPKITGMDGKQYTRPEPKEPRPKASPITDRFTSAVTDLNRLLDRFHRLTEDQAFRRNTDTIRGLHRADINRAIRELQTLADAL